MRLALGVEYNGANFCGWERQKRGRTVQGCIEVALSKVADHPVRVITAGRTDAGVHALGQVIHFDSDASRTMRSWVFGANSFLERDVSVTWARPVSDAFHARFAARWRHYRYVILNRAVRPGVMGGKVSWCCLPLDEHRMAEAAAHLLGEHDFSSYRAMACQAKNPVRTVHRLDIGRRGELVTIDIVANAFLHHMVRNIAGVLMAIGAGKHTPAWAGQVLAARDRTAGGVTAPAQGLYLVGVGYPDEFAIPVPDGNPLIG